MTVLERIRKKHPNSKVMFVFRHGEKTADGQHITPESIEDIIENGPRTMGLKSKPFDLKGEEIYLCLGSDELRTQETAFAVASWALKNGAILQGYRNKNHILGGAVIFDQFTQRVKSQMKSKKLTPIDALATFKKEFFLDWIFALESWIDLAFLSIKDGQIMLVPCHSPTVEAMYNIFKSDLTIKTGNLEGIFLVEKEDEQVVVFK